MAHLDGLPYELARGDTDSFISGGAAGRLYGGQRRANVGRFWVAALQRTLSELGFDLRASGQNWAGAVLEPAAGNSNATFDRETEWAVREFQVAAHMSAATVGFSPGPISGVLDARTAECLRRWTPPAPGLSHTCPVVVSGFGTAPNQPERRDANATPAANQESLWRADQLQTSTRVFAKDATGYFPNITGRVYTDYNVLGAVTTFEGPPGPITDQRHSWTGPNDTSEVLPTRLFPAGTQFNAAKLSTYRVVRAVSETEAPGGFEGSNAYDSQLISVGLMHWTISPWGEANQQRIPIIPAGELPAFWGYFAHRHPGVFRRYFSDLGVITGERWRMIGGASTGRALRNSGARKYETTAAASTVVDGLAELFPKVDLTPSKYVISGDAAYVRNWHLIQRLVMAARAVPEYQQTMGEFARIRIRDLLLTPWPGGGNMPTRNGAPATLGDTFRSERCVAMIVRWHVKSPAHIVSNSQAGSQLRFVYGNIRGNAPFNGNDDTDTWTEEHERAFATALLARFRNVVNSGSQPDNTMPKVADWPGAGNALQVREILRSNVPANLALGTNFTITLAGNAAAYGELTVNPPAGNESVITSNSTVHTRFGAHLGTIATSLKLRWTKRRTAAPAGWVGWEVEEVDESDANAPRHRLFELSRANGNVTAINVTESPFLRLVRNFDFDSSGLPPPDLFDKPDVWEQNTAGNAAADVLAAELTAAAAANGTPLTPGRREKLKEVLQHLAPFTDFQVPTTPNVTVEESNSTGNIRWQINIEGNVHFREATIRLFQGNITVDPPGFSCRYKSGGNLANDLLTLGFPGGAANTTEALREFQIISRRSRIARMKGTPTGTNRRDELEPYTLTADEQARYCYSGPANGERTNETVGLIDHWLSKRMNWRSPVVFEVREKPATTGQTPSVVVGSLDNVWSLGQGGAEGRTVWVTDLSLSNTPQPLALFEHEPANTTGWRSRNIAGFEPCSDELAELTLERVHGNTTGNATATYAIFWAVMDISCGGTLDGVDARFLDDVFLFGGTRLDGQFGALLALARDMDRAAASLIETEGWQGGGAWQPEASARRGRPYVWSVASSQPTAGLCPESQPLVFDKAMTANELQSLRHWHWYYRLFRAGRHEPVVPSANPGTTVRRHGYARALWNYTLVLLRVLTRVPVPGDPGIDLGHVATTQRAWAILLYWYLRHQNDLVTSEPMPTGSLGKVIQTARTGAPGNETKFQTDLVAGLSNMANSTEHDSVFKINVSTLAGLNALSITPDSWNGSQLDAI